MYKVNFSTEIGLLKTVSIKIKHFLRYKIRPCGTLHCLLNILTHYFPHSFHASKMINKMYLSYLCSKNPRIYLKRMCSDILRENAKDSHQPRLVFTLACLKSVLHGHACCQGTLNNLSIIHVRRGSRVVNDDGSCVSFFSWKLSIQSSDL